MSTPLLRSLDEIQDGISLIGMFDCLNWIAYTLDVQCYSCLYVPVTIVFNF